MSPDPHDPAEPVDPVDPLDVLVARRRLQSAAKGDRRRFTVERTRALLELRRSAPDQWAFSWDLLRLANVLSDAAEVGVEWTTLERGGETEALEFTVQVPGANLDEIELGGLLVLALETDGGANPPSVADRVRNRLGAAINGALGLDPRFVDVITPAAGRTFSRLPTTGDGVDPYRPQPTEERAAPDTLVMRVGLERKLGDRLASWLGPTDGLDALRIRWAESLPGRTAHDAREVLALTGSTMPGYAVRLGDHGTWWRAPKAGGPWLTRDGIIVASLAGALRAADVRPESFQGWIECAALRRTADGTDVARDAAFDLLMAWLHDAQAHTFADGGVIWPEHLTSVATVSGRPVELESIARRSLDRGDIPYVWSHQSDSVPGSMRARVLQLWPSSAALLEAAFPAVRFVHLGVLGASPQLQPVDLDRLIARSFPPVKLPAVTLPQAGHARLDLTAYVHRGAGAPAGSIVMLAYERRIAVLRKEEWVVPGVTLVCRIEREDRPTVDALQGDTEGMAAVASACRGALEEAAEDLVAVAFASGNPWEVTYVQARAGALDGRTLGLRYAVSEGLLRLHWHPSALLGLPVGRDAQGTLHTLGEALVRCREIGGVVLGSVSSRWRTLEAAQGPLAPWFPSEEGRALLERVLGSDALWEMPTVPEARLQVGGGPSQKVALLDRDAAHDALNRSTTDPQARADLRGHLLAALDMGAQTLGLESVPLFTRYDPRAARPSRLVPFDRLRDDGSGLAYPGVVSRDLPSSVVEAGPAEAERLHRHLGLSPSAPAVRGKTPDGAARPRRRSAAAARPLVSLKVVDPAAAGTLHVVADPKAGGGVGLWARGVQVGTVQLEGGFASVGGRLWLTQQGIRRGDGALRADLRRWAQGLVEEARRSRLLAPPGTARRRALEAFIEQHGPHGAPDGRRGALRSVREDPLRKLPSVRRLWLQALVRQALPVKVAFDRAWLSWRPVTLEGPVDAPTLVFGGRHRWIQRAESEEGVATEDAFLAAALVAAEAVNLARDRGAAWGTDERRVDALYRIAAMAYAHGEQP